MSKDQINWGCRVEATIRQEKPGALHLSAGWTVISDTMSEDNGSREVVVGTEIDVTAEDEAQAREYVLDDCKADDVCCPVQNDDTFFLSVVSIEAGE